MNRDRKCGGSEQFRFYGPTPPDRQQKAMYLAEERFMNEPPPGESKFADRAEAQEWMERLIAHPVFTATYPDESSALAGAVPEVKVGTAATRIGVAELGSNTLRLSGALGGAGMTLPVMLHEMSHFIHSKTDGFRSEEAHGPQFAAIYLDMVGLVCGEDQARRLSDDFREGGLRVAANSRRISDNRESGGWPPAEGLLAAGLLPAPTDKRTAEKIAAGKADHYTKKAARQWRNAWKKANTWASVDPDRPEAMMRKFAESNRPFWEGLVKRGAVLPDDLQQFLGMRPTPSPNLAAPPVTGKRAPATAEGNDVGGMRAAATIRSGDTRMGPRCGKLMPRAKRCCERPKNHGGSCR